MNASKLEELLDRESNYDVTRVSKGKGLHRFRVHYGGHQVWLQERGGGAAIQLEVDRTSSGRSSTDTTDWLEALKLADGHIYEQVVRHNEDEEIDRAVELAGGDPELLRLIAIYRKRRFIEDRKAKDYVGVDHRKRLERVWAITERLFGLRRRASGYGTRFAERYIKARTTQAIVFPDRMGRRACRPVRRRTAVNELKDFSGVLTWAEREKLLGTNPLAGYEWDDWLQGDAHAVEHMEEAHTRRHTLLMAPIPGSGESIAPVQRVRAWDGGARIRVLQALLFHHAHRVVSNLELDCGDIAFEREAVRALLREAPNHREWWADHWDHGAIFWRRSKVDYLRVTPMSQHMGLEMLWWRDQHPDWRPGMPVLTQQRDPRKPLWYDQVYTWMREAITIAGEDLERANTPGDRIARWLAGAPLHGWRDHWATLMDRLGWGWDAAAKAGEKKLQLHNHVAFFGDWKVTGGTQAEIYSKLHPGILQAVADFEKAEEVVRRYSAEAEEDVGDALGTIYGGEADDVVPIDRGRRA